jgi:PAS domain S-box-containing protein
VPIEANAALLNMLGYAKDELRSLRLADLEARESDAEIVDRIRRIQARGEDDFETRLRTRSGDVLDVSVRIRVLELGGMSRFQTIVRDITAQKKAQELIRSAQQRNELLIRQTPLGVIVWDVHGRVLEWNPTAERLFGYTAAQAMGRSFGELIVPGSAMPLVRRIWEELMAQRGGTRSTNENVTAQGRRILCDWYNTPMVNAQGVVIGVASLVQDVTELKRLEEELRQSQKMEAVGRLASGVAHDFSNLITAISGFTSLARRTLSPQHPAVRSLDRVDDAARQAVGVTKALLTFSRGGSAEKRPVQLGQTVEDSLRLFRRTLPATIAMRSRQDPEPVWVHADPTQLQQVVMNLIINARDAMPEGGSLTVSVHGDGDSASIRVADTGSGMTPDILSHIFEPFFTTKPQGEGTGLGLSISHAIVKDHGGRIEVQSQPGRGSTFTVILPRSAERPAETDRGEPPPPVGAGQAIVLVSGRAYTRELMAAALRGIGYAVTQIGGLAEMAARSNGAGRPLFVIDLDTFGIPASEAAAAALANADPKRTLLLTSEASLGATDSRARLLRKPVHMNELADAVSEALQ